MTDDQLVHRLTYLADCQRRQIETLESCTTVDGHGVAHFQGLADALEEAIRRIEAPAKVFAICVHQDEGCGYFVQCGIFSSLDRASACVKRHHRGREDLRIAEVALDDTDPCTIIHTVEP